MAARFLEYLVAKGPFNTIDPNEATNFFKNVLHPDKSYKVGKKKTIGILEDLTEKINADKPEEDVCSWDVDLRERYAAWRRGGQAPTPKSDTNTGAVMLDTDIQKAFIDTPKSDASVGSHSSAGWDLGWRKKGQASTPKALATRTGPTRTADTGPKRTPDTTKSDTHIVIEKSFKDLQNITAAHHSDVATCAGIGNLSSIKKN